MNNENLTLSNDGSGGWLEELTSINKSPTVNEEDIIIGPWKLGTDYEKLITCHERLGGHDEKNTVYFKKMIARYNKLVTCLENLRASYKKDTERYEKITACCEKLKEQCDKLVDKMQTVNDRRSLIE
jgi:hypothetical protein